MANSSQPSRQWLINLSKRVNVLNLNVPYIPLLLKDITAYAQSSDFGSNLIQTIQTIGYLQREGNIIKLVDFNTKDVELLLCLKLLHVTNIYFKTPRNNCHSIWDYNAVRVYGTLVKEGTQITLKVLYIFEIKDTILAEKMFETLSILARKGYHQYFARTADDKLLNAQWKLKRL